MRDYIASLRQEPEKITKKSDYLKIRGVEESSAPNFLVWDEGEVNVRIIEKGAEAELALGEDDEMKLWNAKTLHKQLGGNSTNLFHRYDPRDIIEKTISNNARWLLDQYLIPIGGVETKLSYIGNIKMIVKSTNQDSFGVISLRIIQTTTQAEWNITLENHNYKPDISGEFRSAVEVNYTIEFSKLIGNNYRVYLRGVCFYSDTSGVVTTKIINDDATYTIDDRIITGINVGYQSKPNIPTTVRFDSHIVRKEVFDFDNSALREP